MLGTGLPMGLQFSITAIGSVMVQWSVNGLGVNAVAAVSGAGKLSMFFACVFDALASTMATYAGQNMGARKLDRIHQGLRCTSVLGIVYCVLAFGVAVLFAGPLLSLFIDAETAPEVTAMGIRYLITNAAFYIPLLFVNILRLSIQGMGFTRVAMLAGLSEMVARTVVALFVVPAFGFAGACFANPAAWIMADLFLFPCYWQVMRSLRQRLMPSTKPLFSKGDRGFVMPKYRYREKGRNPSSHNQPFNVLSSSGQEALFTHVLNSKHAGKT